MSRWPCGQGVRHDDRPRRGATSGTLVLQDMRSVRAGLLALSTLPLAATSGLPPAHLRCSKLSPPGPHGVMVFLLFPCLGLVVKVPSGRRPWQVERAFTACCFVVVTDQRLTVQWQPRPSARSPSRPSPPCARLRPSHALCQKMVLRHSCQRMAAGTRAASNQGLLTLSSNNTPA